MILGGEGRGEARPRAQLGHEGRRAPQPLEGAAHEQGEGPAGAQPLVLRRDQLLPEPHGADGAGLQRRLQRASDLGRELAARKAVETRGRQQVRQVLAPGTARAGGLELHRGASGSGRCDLEGRQAGAERAPREAQHDLCVSLADPLQARMGSEDGTEEGLEGGVEGEPHGRAEGEGEARTVVGRAAPGQPHLEDPALGRQAGEAPGVALALARARPRLTIDLELRRGGGGPRAHQHGRLAPRRAEPRADREEPLLGEGRRGGQRRAREAHLLGQRLDERGRERGLPHEDHVPGQQVVLGAQQAEEGGLDRRRRELGAQARQPLTEDRTDLPRRGQGPGRSATADDRRLLGVAALVQVQQQSGPAVPAVADGGEGGLVQQQHRAPLRVRVGLEARDGAPEGGGQRNEQQPGRPVPEALGQLARVGVLEHLLPEQGRDDLHPRVAHPQPLEEVEPAREGRQSGNEGQRGQVAEAHAWASSRGAGAAAPPRRAADTWATASPSQSTWMRATPRRRQNALSSPSQAAYASR